MVKPIDREEEAAAVLVGLVLLTMLKKPTPTPPPPDKVTTPEVTEPIITPTPPEVSPPPPPEIVEETPSQPAPAPQPQELYWYLVSDIDGLVFWCTTTRPEELPSTLYKHWYTYLTKEACELSRWYYQRQASTRCERYFKDLSPWTETLADCYLDEDAPACSYTCIDETRWVYRVYMRPTGIH